MRYRGLESTLNLAGSPPGDKRSVEARAAAAILAAHEGWRQGFEEITGRARERFERRDWRGAQADATARLALYRIHLDNAVADVRDLLDDALMERTLWAAIKTHHARAMAHRGDAEIAQTFFNSVTRRVFSTVGVDAAIEYLDPDAPSAADGPPAPTERYGPGVPDGGVLLRLLRSYQWSVPWAQAERDAELVAAQMRRGLSETGLAGPVTIEMLRPVFYRNKGAYLVGRILAGGVVLPLVLPLIHAERGIVVDAVLMTQNEASVVFGFSWTYFRVEAPQPRALVEFLASIIANKRLDELYTAIGYNKHGKTVLYRSLMEHLEDPAARFAFAEGDEGMVMAVFTLPAFNVVFKIIKDSFGAPKNTTRQVVMDKYNFVFVLDRVGGQADAAEYDDAGFTGRCVPHDLLAYLLRVAGATVRVEGGQMIVRQLYTERRVTPLNLYLRDAGEAAARDAVIDYGTAIKDLAAADIFTGDMLLKNFGVTRNGRVICYDYDELCLLSDCHFRKLPEPTTIEEEFSAEPWFHVAEGDVFPEEFRAFLVPPGPVREAFLEAHADLLDVGFWQGVQRRLAEGEVFDVFPYRRSAELKRSSGT